MGLWLRKLASYLKSLFLNLMLGGLFMGVLDLILFPLFPNLKFDLVSRLEEVLLLAFSLWHSRFRKNRESGKGSIG